MRSKGVLAVAMMFGMALTARAQVPQQPLPQVDSDRQLAQIINVLENTKTALLNTNHNYATHKNSALVSMVAAQNHLLRALSQQPVAVLGRPLQPGINPEPRAIADARLSAAINTLNASIKIMLNSNKNYNGHKNSAIKELQTSIEFLNRALRHSARQGGR